MTSRVSTEAPDDIERAHLRDPRDTRFTVCRYAPSTDLATLVRRYWLPVWDVPEGERSPQRVLQYPVCLVVVSNTYARFYGPTSALSTTALEGTGWAVGVMLQPAAGLLVTGRPVRELTDRVVDLGAVPSLDPTRLVAGVRAAMTDAPTDPVSHTAGVEAMAAPLRAVLPVDDEGRLVNDIVDLIESTADLLRVDDLCARLDIGERALQRLLLRRVGLGPKWLIRRRRLHEAAEGLRHDRALATVAADLGYADQAHLTRDFRRSTGLTPGEFAARFRAGLPPAPQPPSAPR